MRIAKSHRWGRAAIGPRQPCVSFPHVSKPSPAASLHIRSDSPWASNRRFTTITRSETPHNSSALPARCAARRSGSQPSPTSVDTYSCPYAPAARLANHLALRCRLHMSRCAAAIGARRRPPKRRRCPDVAPGDALVGPQACRRRRANCP
ncbi:hypothetical protein K505DRAFT_142440 [Melanomma pulvis-pyrius CBS 109.77]|uniref:Uncharacterized protein n=1 Tax=Melanomma pulvis-pyrius CBS 109.77 TaxID=1314802 RepID=A0A6A6XMM5_9PLEO|nr:hypothetical protein K505DRAFT_142440 [Melanomma pulvis-pyrius CBS 109.77]